MEVVKSENYMISKMLYEALDTHRNLDYHSSMNLITKILDCAKSKRVFILVTNKRTHTGSLCVYINKLLDLSIKDKNIDLICQIWKSDDKNKMFPEIYENPSMTPEEISMFEEGMKHDLEIVTHMLINNSSYRKTVDFIDVPMKHSHLHPETIYLVDKKEDELLPYIMHADRESVLESRKINPYTGCKYSDSCYQDLVSKHGTEMKIRDHVNNISLYGPI